MIVITMMMMMVLLFVVGGYNDANINTLVGTGDAADVGGSGVATVDENDEEEEEGGGGRDEAELTFDDRLLWIVSQYHIALCSYRE